MRLLKTIIWFIISDIWAFLLTWLFFGHPFQSLIVTLTIGTSMFVLYYWYEWVWDRIYKRRDIQTNAVNSKAWNQHCEKIINGEKYSWEDK